MTPRNLLSSDLTHLPCFCSNRISFAFAYPPDRNDRSTKQEPRVLIRKRSSSRSPLISATIVRGCSIGGKPGSKPSANRVFRSISWFKKTRTFPLAALAITSCCPSLFQSQLSTSPADRAAVVLSAPPLRQLVPGQPGPSATHTNRLATGTGRAVVPLLRASQRARGRQRYHPTTHPLCARLSLRGQIRRGPLLREHGPCGVTEPPASAWSFPAEPSRGAAVSATA